MKYQVSYTHGSERFACEYATAKEANYHHRDIAGYEGIFDVRTDPIHTDDPPNKGPFSLMEPKVKTRFNRKEPV